MANKYMEELEKTHKKERDFFLNKTKKTLDGVPLDEARAEYDKEAEEQLRKEAERREAVREARFEKNEKAVKAMARRKLARLKAEEQGEAGADDKNASEGTTTPNKDASPSTPNP